MKKITLILALIPTLAFSQTTKEVNLNLELIKEGNKNRNAAIVTAVIGSAFAYWGTTRESAKPMVFIGIATASLSIPMTIIGNRRIKKGIKYFD